MEQEQTVYCLLEGFLLIGKGLKDFCGLEKDGLVDGNFRNVHFVYHLNFRRTVLGRTFPVQSRRELISMA
jgi:hypothetical protein